MKYFTLLFLIVQSAVCFGQATTKTENVIVITLDGFRWQELFTGAEKSLISKEFVSDSVSLMKKFWRETPEERREVLLPFVWSVISKEGQLYGNRKYGNNVNVTNQQWFSYPGYSEIFCGFADDARIHSNDKINNPNTTVLEFINSQQGFKGKVAAYSSWDCFPFILNASRSGIPVNSGIIPAKGKMNEHEVFLNELMREVPNPLGEVRLDAFTFHYAFEYFKKNKPRVLYISFDETDDFAHGGKYDLYLEAAHYTDGFLKKIWEECQHDPQYKDKTTMIITVDHGRGSMAKSDWRSHGIKVNGADQIWIAAIGPDSTAMGEVKGQGQLYQNQVAKTIAALLRLNYANQPAPGEAIKSVEGK